MKLLIVTDIFPYPPEKNGNTENIYNLIVQLTERLDYQIDLIFIGKIHQISPDRVKAIKKFIRNLFLFNLINPKLIRSSKWFFPKNFNIRVHYDIIFFASFLSAYARFCFSLDTKYVLYQADSRTFKYSKESGVKNKFRYYKYKIEQRFLFKQFNKVIFVSERDEKEVNSYIKNGNNTLTIPIGCNIDTTPEEIQELDKTIDLIFTGNFHFPPNSEAATYFISDIAPSLINALPDISIYFVGRNPDSQMFEAASLLKNNITITGEVTSIMEYIKKSKIYISPLSKGSGMKNKILQAMVHALPIIASFESTSGFYENNSILVANTKDEWINHIKFLINNEGERKNLGERNFELVKTQYTFEIIAERHFDYLFRNLASKY